MKAIISQFTKKVAQVPGPVLIVLAASLWALDGVLRRSLFSLPPLTIVTLEHVIGFGLLLPVVGPVLWRRRAELSRPKVVGLTLMISVLSGLLGTLWFTTALVRVNFIAFSVVFLLQKLQPLFAITSAKLFLNEALPAKFLAWAVIALISGYFVTFPYGVVNLETGAGTVSAALFAVGAAAAWGTTTTFSKMLIREVGETVATGLRFGVTSLLALMALALTSQMGSIAAVELTQLSRLVLIALSTGMVALWIYYTGLKNTKASVSTILELTFPLLAVLIDTVAYKTTLAPTQYLAAVVLMYAMYQVGKLPSAQSKEAVCI